MSDQAYEARKLETVELAAGYAVPRLIQGGWQLSAGHRARDLDRRTVLERLRRRVDAGLVAFDGADIYTGVETLYGELLQSLDPHTRSRVRIHTKCVPDRSRLPELGRGDLRRLVDRSLARLGIERLDLVQFHWWDFAIDGWIDAVGHLDELRREGKIRALGVTNFDPEHLEPLLAAGLPVVAHQVQYSLLDRRPESSLVELCEANGIDLLCYGTLAGGFLTDRWLGKAEPREPLANRSLAKYLLIIRELGGWKVFQELLRLLRDLADAHGVSVADVAVRWVLDRPGAAAAIVGIRGAGGPRELDEALVPFRLRLRAEDHRRLDAFLAAHPGPAGEIYALERVPGGPHAVIMKTDLNREG